MITTLPNILIVDDIEVNLILLETALRKEQAKIFKATGGIEALGLTDKHEFALIILDVSMPGMNGFELAAHIRKQQLNSTTPIIFISAILFDEFSVSQGYRSGAVDYLSKPYHHEILVSKVRVFLQLYNQKKELEHQKTILEESNERYKTVQETLKVRLQLQKAVSLASARFSGNFELNNSIQFMLRDIANVCCSTAACFLSAESNSVLCYNEDDNNTTDNHKIPTGLKSILTKVFSNYNEAPILISFDGLTGPWILPYKKEFTEDTLATIAINVTSGEKHFGFIIIHDSAAIALWKASELNALSVFGTITGNALERNKTRLDLVESELRYRSYIENAPEGIVVVDNKGTIVEYNKAFSEMFSDIPEYSSLKNINKLFSNPAVSGYPVTSDKLLNGKQTKCEFIVTGGNQQKLIKTETVKLPGKQFLIFCTDVTLEREFEKHLVQTERMVAIGEMSTGIAHEINQPLNTISFSVDNLLQAVYSDSANPDYIKEKSKKIFDSIHRMRNIIDHVRNFARGNDDIILSDFPAIEPVENALSLYTEQLKTQGIKVVKDYSGDVEQAKLHGNTYKIEQVLLNIFSNARDAMNDKKNISPETYEPKIMLKASLERNNLILTVSDNGTGMTQEQLKNITKPFVTGKAPGKGTGLGLAISQKIVSEHNGKLSFNSIYSEGTTVKLELPLALKSKSQSVKA